MVVNGGVDQGVRLAAIFGLHIKHEISKLEIRVVTEEHGRANDLSVSLNLAPGLVESAGERGNGRVRNLSGTFDRWRLTRYYNSSTIDHDPLWPSCIRSLTDTPAHSHAFGGRTDSGVHLYRMAAAE